MSHQKDVEAVQSVLRNTIATLLAAGLYSDARRFSEQLLWVAVEPETMNSWWLELHGKAFWLSEE